MLDLVINDLEQRLDHKQLNANSGVRSISGSQVVKDGQTDWKPTPTLEAMRNGRINLVDDIGKPRQQAVVSKFNNILQFGQIHTPYRLEVAKPGFTVIATTTPEEARYATQELSGEVEDRFSLMYMPWQEHDEEVAFLRHEHPALDGSLLAHLVDAARVLREQEESRGEFVRPVTPQDLSATLDRWQRQDRTLFEVLLSIYGVEPDSDYAKAVHTVLEADPLDLASYDLTAAALGVIRRALEQAKEHQWTGPGRLADV